MKTEKYTFHCRFTTEALLPQFKGSTLRGALGHALKKITCALRTRSCQNCLLFNSCAYAFFYELKSPTEVKPNDNHKFIPHRPHPYLISPPVSKKRHYLMGESFSFSLQLFGQANDYLPHLVYAIQEMGAAGLGKKTTCPGHLNLERVSRSEQEIFTPVTGLTIPKIIPDLALQPTCLPLQTLTVTCDTPLRIKQNNSLCNTLPFHALIRAALRRISSLENVYGDGEPPLDYKGLAKEASNVQIAKSAVHWLDLERYSNRQKTTMLFGGLSGSITYTGDNLAHFAPLLKYCEITHLGKQTSFGLGQITLSTNKTRGIE